ncbi:Rieske 2Fe-2S domain-containing protein [Novosphingobium sp. KCTC 2891]|uniref:aromatic ring-hydroxylating oxygenase subunit alpha n=1 Tax=Novosphingobium sp. KCTC 2891 TaxID=2989730 RepID=UPI0022226E64|nr:SRPBCC family protein [Novosphingobium sp. KCTC 2891]MCW1382771.1 Rieske 2Fe-2S domain-containing protein [Novosphingobium sp. KCTC 2891]
MTGIYEKYGDAAERMLHFVETKTTDQASDVLRVPVADYLDEGRWQKEIDRIFKRLPLMLALTIELPQVNDYKAMDVMGMPVLITRGKDGKARAFLNVCKHRAMHLAPEGKGNCARFACQYHGWTYANDGKLIGIAEASTFGDVDRSTLHMTELPCDEAAGLIFVILTPGLPIDAVEWMGGMYEDFAALKLETWYYHKSKPMKGANWKVAYDGYLEGYHFQAAHTNTVATRSPSNRATYEGFGPHIRLGFPQNSIVRLKDLPRDEWGKQENNGYDFIRMMFPNFSFFLAPEMGQLAQLFPGPKANQNTTVMNYIFPTRPETPEGLETLDKMCDFFFDVVEEEDYFLGLKVQNGLESGAMTHQTFGRNEPGNQFFHKWVAYYLDETGQTPKPVMKE